MSSTERHFAVANVGDDGTIYLRPSDRAPSAFGAHPPAFGLPPSPPMSPSELEMEAPNYWHDGLHESAAAATSVSVPHHTGVPGVHDPRASSTGSSIKKDMGRRSSLTNPHYPVRTALSALQQNPPARPVPRERTERNPAYDSNRLHPSMARRHSVDRPTPVDSPMILQVPIPTYRIGTPRIGDRGTVYLHDSFYSAGSEDEDNRVSNFSHLELDDVFPAPPGMQTPTAFLNYDPSRALTAAPNPPEATQGIDPNIYNAFVFDSENPRYIRYMANGHILAATPARLIAQITHVKFLDYDLLSDFFLTYRSFLSSKDLLRYLIARLRWAVFCGGSGRIVRVRAFVATRHWILNYFMDDFEPDYDLRLLFCNLVNNLSNDLYTRPDKGGGDLQVIGELKKCWRRVCDVIWGTNDGTHPFPATHDISPGGPGGNKLILDGIDEQDHARRQQEVQEDFFNQPSFAQKHARIVSYDPIDMANMVTSPTSPWRPRQDSMDVTSCSIPMWRRFGQASPSFRPRALMPVTEISRPLGEVSKLPSSAHRHKQSKGSKSSTETAIVISPPQEDPVIFHPRNEVGPFNSGDLIRGVLVPPPLPQVTKQVRVGKEVGFDSDVENSEREGKKTNMVGQVKRKLSSRNGTFGSRDGSATSSPKRQDTGNKRAKMPTKTVLVSRSDFLASRVAEAYEKLIREDQDGNRSTPKPELPNGHRGDSSDAGALVDGQHERNGSIADIDKDLPAPPSRSDRFNSHMTTSSRSIMIINDIENPVPAMPNFDLHDQITPADTRVWQRSPRRIQNAFDMQSNGELPLGFPQREGALSPASPNSLQPSVTSLKIGGASQRVQYSASTSARSESPPQGLGLLMPDASRGSYDDQSERNDYRQSSTLEPFDAVSDIGPAYQKQLRRRPGGDLRAADNVDELAHARPRRNSTGSIALNRMSRTTSATLSTEIIDAQVGSKLTRARLVSHHANDRHSGIPRRQSLQLLSTHSSRPNLRPSFQVEVDKLAKLPNDEEDDGGLESTLAKLEGRSPLASPTEPSLSIRSPVAPPASPEGQELIAAAPAPTTTPEQIPSPPPTKPKRRSRVQVIGHPDHPETSRLILDDQHSPITETMGASIYNPSRTSRGTPDARLRDSAMSEDPYLINGDRVVSSNGGRWSHVAAPTPRRSNSVSKSNWPLVGGKDSAHDQPRSSTRASSNTPKSSFLLNDDESLSSDDGHDDDEQRNTSRASGRQSRGDQSFFIDEDGDEDIRARTPTFGAFEPPLSPPPSTPLPAIPFAAPPLYDPMPGKAATRLRTPGPDPSKQGQSLKEASSFPFPPAPAVKPTIASWQSNPNFSLNQLPAKSAMKTKHIPLDASQATTQISRSLHASHTPFVLAFPSSLLASQLTIIERDALSEIDWQELVSLNWSAVPPTVHNWAEYMRLPSQSGVDIVIARFNLVVKWAVSEILLTNDVHDRARTISKFIHVAAHSRRLRNFATMYQLTVALCSEKVVRLKRTWLLVSAAEKEVLKALETIVQPMRNFARMRSEMEAALLAPALTPEEALTPPEHSRSNSRAGLRTATSHGSMDMIKSKAEIVVQAGACVPFIGIYTHDLAFNAQKPAFVDADPGKGGSETSLPSAKGAYSANTTPKMGLGTSPAPSPSPKSASDQAEGTSGVVKGKDKGSTPLNGTISTDPTAMVNFERFQTKAGIVKNLLRLLEASARYAVRPNKEVVARCLWLAALEEGELEGRSRGLEPGTAGTGTRSGGSRGSGR
ncbi:RasGEF domain-containing protein 3 [Elsinoe fawcettii]|nr:RasGEF domain-containing protein 3 [Elsinoe fawcettii]